MVMLLELNEVLIEGERQTSSMMAYAGELTCLTGGTATRRTRWLLAMQGFIPVTHGCICIDGEPLTTASSPVMRKLISYSPSRLCESGEVTTYKPPTVQDVFSLRQNRGIPISNGILGEEVRRIGADILGEEVRRIGADADDPRVQLLAVAVLLNRPIVIVDDPPVEAGAYLKQLTAKGKLVVVATGDDRLLAFADKVAELL